MLTDSGTADKESTPCPRLGLYKMGERFYAPAQIRAFLPFNGAAGLETLLVTWFILGLGVLLTYCLLSTITFGLLIKVSTSEIPLCACRSRAWCTSATSYVETSSASQKAASKCGRRGLCPMFCRLSASDSRLVLGQNLW